MIGSVAHHLDAAFSKNVAEVGQLQGGRGINKQKEKVAVFVEEYEEDTLFSEIAGRSHAHFLSFSAKNCHQKIKNPQRLRDRLMKYSVQLDKARYASNLEARR